MAINSTAPDAAKPVDFEQEAAALKGTPKEDYIKDLDGLGGSSSKENREGKSFDEFSKDKAESEGAKGQPDEKFYKTSKMLVKNFDRIFSIGASMYFDVKPERLRHTDAELQDLIDACTEYCEYANWQFHNPGFNLAIQFILLYGSEFYILWDEKKQRDAKMPKEPIPLRTQPAPAPQAPKNPTDNVIIVNAEEVTDEQLRQEQLQKKNDAGEMICQRDGCGNILIPPQSKYCSRNCTAKATHDKKKDKANQ
jgi:hypothetical protein